jgi:hypothetical protein
MSETRSMLATVVAEPSIDLAQLATTVDALAECEELATACGIAMVQEPDVAELAGAIRMDQDNADLCQAAQRVLARSVTADAELVRAVLQAAILGCERSAAECARFADRHEHCRLHSKSARRCADATRALLDGLRA